MSFKISVCIIGLNEEKKIKDCLESVKPIADEIIFVDSFSTDNTLKIVSQYTKKIFKKKFTGYVDQKNFAIDKATHDWVLSLDCDERLTPEAIDDIRQVFKTRGADIQRNEIRAIAFNRLTFYIYRFIYHSGWYPDTKIRLFNRQFCRWQGDTIHEKLECKKEHTVFFKSDILHYSFDSISDHLRTIDKFSTIAAREAYDRGRKAGVFTIIARSAWVGVRKIFFEFAYLDGAAGIILTGLSMTATWAKYSRLYLLCRADKNNK